MNRTKTAKNLGDINRIRNIRIILILEYAYNMAKEIK